MLAFFFLSIIRYFRCVRLPEEIELYRDRKWRREESPPDRLGRRCRGDGEDLGFCLGMTDARKDLPSVYIAVCGRRDAHMPRNVQKDYEASRAWVLKDETLSLAAASIMESS